MLDDRSNRRKVIFVVGPSGAGKTVLVRSVYKRRMADGQFHCHAWLSLSHTDNPEQRLENLLSQFFGMRINDLHSPVGADQKSCLLYFSLFPEDYSIKRERLIRLWLSEGFVDESGNASPEKIAEDSLNELISRNLVDASSRDFRGWVKSCRVLNLMRQFICQKSKEKKFAAVVTDRDMHQRDGPIYRRLSIENASSGLRRTGGLHLDSVGSLFMFGLDKASSKMIAATLKRIRLLKVLDLENAPLDSFPECVLDAALLRYLSLRNTNVNEIPKTIERLRYLEYLDLKQTQFTCLPEEISSLEYLQHLLVYRCSPMSYDSIECLQGANRRANSRRNECGLSFKSCPS